MMNYGRFFILVAWWLFPLSLIADELTDAIPELKGAGVLLIDSQGQALVSLQAQTSFIPASTTKLVTAWLALNHWGAEHHFSTDFYLDEINKILWVKGSGDPFLVSEEIAIIAANLKKLGLHKIDAIGLDNSLFQTDLIVPGASTTNNPYDAVPTAIAANFNTISVKNKSGKIVSAEMQTPLTPLATNLAQQQALSKRVLRFNTGKKSRDAEQYFAELLAELLRQKGVKVASEVIWGKVPEQNTFYTHFNSKNLAEVIEPMMKYSTNFIANQLVLVLSAEQFNRPASFDDVQQYMERTLEQRFNWTDFTMKEGAGLSRDNQLSPNQLIELLQAFRLWQDLLPEVTTSIYAKSGTLNNVSTLAGYVDDKQNQQKYIFALMMPQAVSHKRRNSIASEIVTLGQN